MDAIDVAALVAVAGVDAGADEAVAHVIARPEGGLHVGAVVGIDVHGVVSAGFPGGFDELSHYFVAVGAAGVLGADGDLLLGAGQAVADTAHVYGNGFCDTCGNGGAATVPHFFVYGYMDVDLTRGL